MRLARVCLAGALLLVAASLAPRPAAAQPIVRSFSVRGCGHALLGIDPVTHAEVHGPAVCFAGPADVFRTVEDDGYLRYRVDFLLHVAQPAVAPDIAYGGGEAPFSYLGSAESTGCTPGVLCHTTVYLNTLFDTGDPLVFGFRGAIAVPGADVDVASLRLGPTTLALYLRSSTDPNQYDPAPVRLVATPEPGALSLVGVGLALGAVGAGRVRSRARRQVGR